MITRKQAYIRLLNLKNTLRNIEENLFNNEPVRAYYVLQRMKEDIETIVKPMHSSLTKKQKRELLDGWDPDTDEGSYITIPDEEFIDEEKK